MNLNIKRGFYLIGLFLLAITFNSCSSDDDYNDLQESSSYGEMNYDGRTTAIRYLNIYTVENGQYGRIIGFLLSTSSRGSTSAGAIYFEAYQPYNLNPDGYYPLYLLENNVANKSVNFINYYEDVFMNNEYGLSNYSLSLGDPAFSTYGGFEIYYLGNNYYNITFDLKTTNGYPIRGYYKGYFNN